MPPKYLNKLQGKRVLVIGGTSGMGFSVAEAAAEHGASVVVASSSAARVQQAIGRIQAAYPEQAAHVSGTTVDLAAADVEQQLTALLEFATKGRARPLHHVVETAGDFPGFKALGDVDAEAVVAPMRVRFIAAMLLGKLAPAYMVPGPEASITFTDGINSAKPGVGWTLMAPVGGAKRAMTRAMAVDLKPVRVNVVCPGGVRTELFDKAGPEMAAQLEETWTAKTLTGRIGRPEEVAEAYLGLMKNTFVTGTEVTCDGGYLLI